MNEPDKLKSMVATLQLDAMSPAAAARALAQTPEPPPADATVQIAPMSRLQEELDALEEAALAAPAASMKSAETKASTPVHLPSPPAPKVAITPVAPPPADATVKLTNEELHGFASTQAATPVRLPASPPRRAETQKLSVSQLLALFRPVPRPQERAAHAQAVQAAAPVRGVRPRQLLVGGVAAALLLGLLAYAGAHTLLVKNHRWVAPTVLSKSDPRVLQLAATLQQESARKSELALRKKELESRAKEAADWRELESGFQASFMAALKNDLDGQRAELARVQRLVADREAADLAAGMMPDHPELDQRLAMVKARVRLLEAALRGGRGTYESLALRREYDRSVLEVQKARELEETLAKSIAEVDEQLKKKDTLLASIDASPYRLAIDQDVTLGFVPYENSASAKAGAPLIACKTSLLFCDRVGEVGDTLAGEVRGLHPATGQEVRGQLVKLSLGAGRLVPDAVLYAEKAPLSL